MHGPSIVTEYHEALQANGHAFEHYDQQVTLIGEIIHPDDEYDHHFQDSRNQASSHLANSHKTKLKEPDYKALQPNFGWALIEMIKKTFAKSTQFVFAICTVCLCASTSRVVSLEPM